MQSSQVSPTDDEVLSCVSEIRIQSPSLGLSKLLSTIKSQQPTWALSEKRLKKLVSKPQIYDSSSRAVSRPTPNLVVPAQLKIQASSSGKGLYAADVIAADAMLFKENPLIWVPKSAMCTLPLDSICAYCGRALRSIGQPLRVHCKECRQTWCTKTCAKYDICHSAQHKFLTCSKRNKQWNTFMDFVVRKESWNGGVAVGYIWTRIICLATTEGVGELAKTSLFAETLFSFSTINQKIRHENSPSWIFEEETISTMWTKGHELLLDALKIHPSYENLEKFLTLEQFLLHLGSKPLEKRLTTGMFNTNNLNGALYPLHSHLNHSCQPSAKAVDVNGRMAELTVVVRDNVIPMGAEITVSYVNPDWPGNLRRDTLKRDYGFECHCERCMADLKDATVTDGKIE